VTEVVVPDLGDFADVPVIEVLVKPGDEVSPEDPLIVLESEKATMEVPSPAAGTIAEIAVKVGDEVSRGDLILTLEGGEGGSVEADVVEKPDEDGGGEDAAGSGEEEPADEEEPEADAEEPSEPGDEEAPAGDGGVYAGPGARRRARELGVDLAGVTGSGRKGRITTEDVEAHAAKAGEGEAAGEKPAKTAAGAPAGDLPGWPEVDFAAFGEIEVVDLPRFTRIAGPRLARNWAAIPHVTQHDEADVTDLEAWRRETNAAHADEGVKVTLVALVLKACAAALRAYPHVNGSLDGGRLVLKRYCHIGVAVDTPQGLLVPVIRDVDRKGVLEIARELADLAGKAREGKLSAEAMEGGTFTVSSLGGIGGTAFTPVINAPEVAILGLSRTATKPVWIDGEFRPRLILPLSLSYDHRVIDGAAAARFAAYLAQLLADMRRALL
jgi:pyruvate dehydrogenase E2 component (dihydrolipoamide acetyltransferase)